MTARTQILSEQEIRAKLDRIAYEIYERNNTREELVLIGIDRRGDFVAKELHKRLKSISPQTFHFLNAEAVRTSDFKTYDASIDDPESIISDGHVILIDDVLYSGTTMMYVLKEIFNRKPKTIQVAVLIDRGHRSLPVSPDYVGLELATTIQQYVSVDVSEDNSGAVSYLF